MASTSYTFRVDVINGSWPGESTALAYTAQGGYPGVSVTDIQMNSGPTIAVPAGSSATSFDDFGNSGDTSGDYFTVAVDADGSIRITPKPASQDLINMINSNTTGAPLFDTLTYDVSDGTTVQSYSAELDLTDITLQSISYTVPVTASGPETSLAGLAVSVAQSTDADGNTVATDPTLTVTVFDAANVPQNEVALQFAIPSGTSVITPDLSTAVAGGYAAYSITGTAADINADLNTLAYSGGHGSSDLIISATESDGVTQMTDPQLGALIDAPALPPPQNAPSYDFYVAPDTTSYGGQLNDAGTGSGNTVIGISTDGVTFVAVPPGGSDTETISGTYTQLNTSSTGADNVYVIQPGQDLINAINANEADGGTAPLSDSYYYELQDTSGNVTVDELTYTLSDVTLNSPAYLGYGNVFTDAPGDAPISLSGLSLTKEVSTSGDGTALPSDPNLGIEVRAFDFTTNASAGTFFVDDTVAGGGGDVSYAAGDIHLYGTQSQINADLNSLTYSGTEAGSYSLLVTTTDDSYTSGYSYVGSSGVFGTIDVVDTAPCYLRGTRIRTAQGDVAIESLRIGDEVVTLSGGLRAIRWIGLRSYAAGRVASDRRLQPVVVSAGALGKGLPMRDLYVSPEHALLLDGMLVPARALVNGTSIRQKDTACEVGYVHLEFDTHDVIYAEGSPAESFVDDESRLQFDNVAEYFQLYPLARPVPARFCAPRVEDGEPVERLRQRLARPSRSASAAAAADPVSALRAEARA